MPSTQSSPESKPLPARIQVLPPPDARGVIRGSDGRAWTLKDRAALLRSLAGREVVLDINHASVNAAPKGGASPAMGWASGFEFGADGALYAAVRWTPYGAALQAQNAYRYISPALTHTNVAEGDTLGDIAGLHSIGLVQHPNFQSMPALNAAQLTAEQKKLCVQLNITEEAFNASRGDSLATNAQANSRQGESPEMRMARMLGLSDSQRGAAFGV